MLCARCGRAAADGGTYCPHCGNHHGLLRWVAQPPPSAHPPAAPRPPAPYAGPPRYPVPPRWGFPALPWVPPSDGVAAPPSSSSVAVRTLAGTLVPVLWATAAVALVAAFAETWRYVLLLASREGALSAGVVAASDALVASAGLIAPTLAALAGVLVVLWTLRAARAAAEVAQVRPPRSSRSIVLGWLVPVVNLSVPGSTLAEIEHAALRRDAGTRPAPSPLLLAWWALWAGGVVLGTVVALWSLWSGVQARADGVVLHALLDLLATATAAVTAVLVTRLTRLLGPVRDAPRELVVGVDARR